MAYLDSIRKTMFCPPLSTSFQQPQKSVQSKKFTNDPVLIETFKITNHFNWTNSKELRLIVFTWAPPLSWPMLKHIVSLVRAKKKYLVIYLCSNYTWTLRIDLLFSNPRSEITTLNKIKSVFLKTNLTTEKVGNQSNELIYSISNPSILDSLSPRIQITSQKL